MICLLRVTSQQGFVRMPAPCSGARPSPHALKSTKDPHCSHIVLSCAPCAPTAPMKSKSPYTFLFMDRRPIGRRLNTCRSPRSGRAVGHPPLAFASGGRTASGRARGRPGDDLAGAMGCQLQRQPAGHGAGHCRHGEWCRAIARREVGGAAGPCGALRGRPEGARPPPGNRRAARRPAEFRRISCGAGAGPPGKGPAERCRQ